RGRALDRRAARGHRAVAAGHAGPGGAPAQRRGAGPVAGAGSGRAARAAPGGGSLAIDPRRARAAEELSMQLTIKQAARFLEVDERQVHAWIDAGEIPFSREHGHIRFNQAELLEWVTTRRMRASHQLHPEVAA